MPIHPVFTLMPACKFLKLFATEDDKPTLQRLLWELREGVDNTSEEIRQYIDEILGVGRTWLDYRCFKAECTKNNICCVLTESVLVNEHTPLSVLVANKDHLLRCSDREEIRDFRNMALESWVLHSLTLD